MYEPKNLEVFLDQVGRGCISGNVVEWPQLKLACKHAAEEIAKLRSEVELHKSVLREHGIYYWEPKKP